MKQGLWNRETVALMTFAALLPLGTFWLWFEGTDMLVRLFMTLLVIAVWQLIFMLARAQSPSFSCLVTALAIAMLAPEELGVFGLTFGISFGVVMGELVFGGWGRNVVNPATVALAFLGFGFPAAPWPVAEVPVAWAAIPAAILGTTLGVMPAALVMTTVLLGAVAASTGILAEPIVQAAGIVLVLLVADPVTSAATTLGRCLHGALYVALVTLFGLGWSGAAPFQIAVAAALLSSLAAPSFDELAMKLWVHHRRRRHGRT